MDSKAKSVVIIVNGANERERVSVPPQLIGRDGKGSADEAGRSTAFLGLYSAVTTDSK